MIQVDACVEDADGHARPRVASLMGIWRRRMPRVNAPDSRGQGLGNRMKRTIRHDPHHHGVAGECLRGGRRAPEREAAQGVPVYVHGGTAMKPSQLCCGSLWI